MYGTLLTGMDFRPINLKEKLAKFEQAWTPKVVAELNDYHIKVVKLLGEFVWHKHDETDEMFLCVDGEMDILFRDARVTLKKGELVVVPKGVEHKPISDQGCEAVIIEPKGITNTGDAGGELTAPNDDWI